MLARSLVGGSGEMLVAASAASAACDYYSLIGTGEIMHHRSGHIVIDNGANRHFEDDAFALLTGAVGALTMAPALRLVLRVISEMDQRVVPLAGFHDDIATTAAVAAR